VLVEVLGLREGGREGREGEEGGTIRISLEHEFPLEICIRA
jgi:hypothetical protein